MRRIALDSETVALLREHRERVRARIEELGGELTGQTFVFSSVRSPDHSEPYSPHAVSSRYKDMADRLGIETHLHSLRHYSATELLTAGVDLRTVAGRSATVAVARQPFGFTRLGSQRLIVRRQNCFEHDCRAGRRRPNRRVSWRPRIRVIRR